MTNLDQSFDASNVMREISKAAPLLLLICALGSFICFGFFSVNYYAKLFEPVGVHSRTMAITMAVITELVRFALLVASIRDFSDKKRFNGWLGLLGSVALVFHDVNVARSIAAMFDAANPTPYSTAFIFLILLGFGLEIRLILTMSNPNKFGSESKNIWTGNEKYFKPEKVGKSNGVHTAEKS